MRPGGIGLALALLLGGAASAQQARLPAPEPREPASAAARAPRVPVRAGDHAGFGRMVFDWPSPPAYRVEQDGDRVRVRFPPGIVGLEAVRRMPRNVLAVRAVEGGVEIMLTPGARLRHFRNGPKVAFDAMDPGAAVPADGRAAPTGAPTRAILAGPAVPSAGTRRGPSARDAAPGAGATGANPAPPQTRPDAALPQAPSRTSPPVGQGADDVVPAAAPVVPRPAERQPSATPPAALPPPAPSADTPAVSAPAANRREASLHLPFPPDAGAAMLRRGDSWLILFDAAAETSMDAPLRAGVRHQAIPGGALITLDAAADWAGVWQIIRDADARWLLAPGEPPSGTPAIHAAADAAGSLVMPAAGAHRVLSVQDPVTGMPLLVGTQRGGGGLVVAPGEMVALRLVETRLGVAVLARSDAVVLRAGADRFVVAADGAQTLALGGATPAPTPTPLGDPVTPAASASRSFDFPPGGSAELAARLRSQRAGLAQSPPLARGTLRLAAAETLMALGQPQEAQAMVALAQQEDPAVAALPRAAWLAGAAALSAGRPEEAEALKGPPISTEAALWRGLLQARQGDAAAAAEALMAGRSILLGYPEALLRRLLPPVAEALATARPEAARVLLADATTPGLELARATLEEGQGHAAQALAAYDRVAQGRDRRGRAEAMRRAAELRLARGELDPRAAAQALEQTLFAWRDEAAEFETRQRIAGLRGQGGDARGALVLLRETAALFPDREAALAPAMSRAFLDALAQETPLGAAALHDAQPGLMPPGAEGVAALALMADRLAALDLPGRATALLRDAMQRAPAGEARAALGARLAALQLTERDNAAAIDTLAGSAAPDLPAALQTERSILAARASGQPQGFAALGAAGDEALAEFLADRRDFPGAAAALGRYLEGALRDEPAPVTPALQRTIVRHAALLALAGDDAGLGRIRAARSALLTSTPAEAPFQLLATDPVRGLADLPRITVELELFRTLPSRLDRLRTASANTR